MASTRRGYIAATFLVSCVALVLLIVALATNSWITSEVAARDSSDVIQAEVNYGLFKGTYIKSIGNSRFTFDITIVCDFGENACVWSCLADSSSRKAQLAEILAGGSSGTTGCKPVRQFSVTGSVKLSPSVSTSDGIQRSIITRDASKDHRFINSGLWICTLLTLILAIVLAAATALLSVVNMAANPVHASLAVEGLYYWNGAAAVMGLMSLIFWGSQYAVTLKDNIAVFEVATANSSFTSAGLASLGWSYWMVLVALLFSASNIGVLFLRDYMLRKEPPPPTYNPDKNVADGTLFLY